MNNEIYKLAFKQLILFCSWVVLARVSKGFTLPVMTFLGVVWAFNGKFGKAFSLYSLLLFMVLLNPNILPKEGIMYSLGLRFGPLIIGLALAMRAVSITRKLSVPLGLMIPYLLVVSVSSIDGWCPQISYLKLVNFTVFFFGIWLGSKGLQLDERGLKILRATLLALATFLIVGSALLWPFPGISTLDAIREYGEIDDVALRNEILKEVIDTGGMTLFCGVVFHSQTLAPLLSCAFSWVLCDLLFEEGRFRLPHVGLLILALPLLYLTRSRVALLSLFVSFMMLYFYLPRKIMLGQGMKKWLNNTLLVGGGIIIMAVIIAEIKGNAISRWLRKTDDVEMDQRSIAEAFTASRQSLIEICMADFHLDPLLGMGFQVDRRTRAYAEMSGGFALSAPIEKGVIPVMVLGESGVVGAIAFAIFLLAFYKGCDQKRLYITILMMTVFLTTNMGEATFFSPGGAGGIEWIMCIVGGYSIDLRLAQKQKGYILR